MSRLKEIIHTTNSTSGRVFDYVIQVLIILSLLTFAISTLPDLSSREIEIVGYLQVFFVVIFTIEYILRLLTAPSRLKYALSFFGIVDLLAILPFYLSLGVDLRSLRAIRILRLFRVMKLVRYNLAIKRISLALRFMKEEIVLFSSASILFLYFASVGIYYFENPAQPDVFSSVFSSFWWAVATLTTVGYGDIYPITVGGRAFTIVILFLGLGLIAIPTGIFASALSKAREMTN